MKLTKLFFFILITSLMTLQSCKTTQNKDTSNSPLEGKWILKSLNGESASSIFTHKIPTLNFDFEKQRVFGSGGCNSYGGNYSLTKDKLTVSNVISTMMACIGAEKEGEFFRVLSKTSDISVNGQELILKQEGKTVLVFEKAKPITAADLSGKWTLDVLEGATANVYFKEKMPFINFDIEKMRVNGNSGCNSYNAPFEVKEGKIEIGMMATTRRACLNGGMEGEKKYTQLLPGTSDLEIEKGRLILKRDGVHVATFSRYTE